MFCLYHIRSFFYLAKLLPLLWYNFSKITNADTLVILVLLLLYPFEAFFVIKDKTGNRFFGVFINFTTFIPHFFLFLNLFLFEWLGRWFFFNFLAKVRHLLDTWHLRLILFLILHFIQHLCLFLIGRNRNWLYILILFLLCGIRLAVLNNFHFLRLSLYFVESNSFEKVIQMTHNGTELFKIKSYELVLLWYVNVPSWRICNYAESFEDVRHETNLSLKMK